MEQCKIMRELTRSDPPPSYEERIRRLDALERMVRENEDTIIEAIDADFGGPQGCRGKEYNILGDVWTVLNTVREVKLHLKEWMQVEQPELGWNRFPFNIMGVPKIYTKPLGLVLVITPWNYPFHIAMSALGDILGAGNRCVLKPSESTPKTSALIAQIVPIYFNKDVVTVMTGGPEVSSTLTRFPFDHILFVGSGEIGKKVASAAAANLCRVTLELGGKNPVFVCSDYDIRAAATSIGNAKLENAGQVCVTCDTVFVPPGTADQFVQALRDLYKTQWGKKPLSENTQYPSIINERHYERLAGMLAEAKEHGAEIYSLDPSGANTYGKEGLKHVPHVIVNPGDSAKISNEEIFGPFLVLREMGLDPAISYVNQRDEPLAAYIFTNDEANKKRVAETLRCGGIAVNHLTIHAAVARLPFGGVGKSGCGCCHGPEAFRNFSHRMAYFEVKPIGLVGKLWDAVGPKLQLPYSEKEIQAIKDLTKPLPPLGKVSSVFKISFLVGIFAMAIGSKVGRQALLPVAKYIVTLLEA